MISTLAALSSLMLAQVGINPSVGGMPGIPDELANRPPRETVRQGEPAGELARCLAQTQSDPAAALDIAQRWRETADTPLAQAQSAHCAGLAMIALNRLDEAQRVFELASGEATESQLAYAARLAGMAGNTAMLRGKPDEALPLLDRAGGMADAAGDKPLSALLRVDLARTLVALGRDADAASALDEARTADAANGEAWLLSATLSRRMQHYAEAQQRIQRAGELDPRNPAVGLEAGVIAALSGREEDAKKSFESVLLVAPDSYEAQRARGYLEQLGGGPPAAAEQPETGR